MIFFYKKSKMLFIIYTASVFLFALAYNICFHVSFQPDKACDFLSDFYSVVYFKEDKPAHKNRSSLKGMLLNIILFINYSFSVISNVSIFSPPFYWNIGIYVLIINGFLPSVKLFFIYQDKGQIYLSCPCRFIGFVLIYTGRTKRFNLE